VLWGRDYADSNIDINDFPFFEIKVLKQNNK